MDATTADTEYERLIALQGAVNFRDIGGYATIDGRRLRWRSLFRADGLSRLSDADRSIVRNLGVATVIDLRSPGELETGRFPIEHIPVAFHHLPLVTEVLDPERFKIIPGMLATRYRQIASDGAPQIAQAISIVADPASLPVIVHCTAGKDRTGVLVAVLLALLGVPDETIIADYAMSAAAMKHLKERIAFRNPENQEAIELADELFSAAPENIASLLTALRDEYGSVGAYAEAAGVGTDVVTALQASLLE